MSETEISKLKEQQELINKLLFILGVCSSYIINPAKNHDVKQWIFEAIDAVIYNDGYMPKFPS